MDHDQVQHYRLDFCVGQDPDFICTLTWWAKSWQAFHYANTHMCRHMQPSGNPLLYFKCTMGNLRKKIQYLYFEGDSIRPEKHPLIRAVCARQRRGRLREIPVEPKVENAILPEESVQSQKRIKSWWRVRRGGRKVKPGYI